jgi:putative FmdB family regulatory protein
MPTYDYKCGNCNNTFEFFQSMKDDPMTLCPECGHNDLKKLVSLPAGLIFKGTGFYLTDYAKKNISSTSTVNNTNSDSTTDSTSNESKTTDKKADKKKESKNNKDK